LKGLIIEEKKKRVFKTRRHDIKFQHRSRIQSIVSINGYQSVCLKTRVNGEDILVHFS